MLKLFIDLRAKKHQNRSERDSQPDFSAPNTQNDKNPRAEFNFHKFPDFRKKDRNGSLAEGVGSERDNEWEY